MSLLLASFLQYLISFPFFVVFPEKKTEHAMIQVYFRAEQLTNEEQEHLKILGDLMLKGSKEFTKEEIQQHLLKAPEIQQGLDYIRLTFFLKKERFSSGLTLIHSILTQPHIEEKDKCFVVLHHKMVQNPNLFFVLAGNLDPIKAQETFYSRFFSPSTRGFFLKDQALPSVDKLTAIKESNQIVLNSDFFKIGDCSSASKFLATVALGAGKGSSLYRILRETQGLTYFQQTGLTPTAKGFCPSFKIFKSSLPGHQSFVIHAKEELLKDINDWSVAHLDRSKGFGKGLCCYGLMPGFFGLGFSDGLKDQAFNDLIWKGYLAFVGDSPVTLSQFSKKCFSVTLPEIQKQAVELIKSAKEMPSN